MSYAELYFSRAFNIVGGNERAQAAVKAVAPMSAEASDDGLNDSDQWLYVVAGEGLATVGDNIRELKPGVLLLVERGQRHQLHNTGHEYLRTLNLYVPPAYTPQGEPLNGCKSLQEAGCTSESE